MGFGLRKSCSSDIGAHMHMGLSLRPCISPASPFPERIACWPCDGGASLAPWAKLNFVIRTVEVPGSWEAGAAPAPHEG